MTTHSINILSELKMSFFGPYGGTNMHSYQLRYQLYSVEGRAKCPTVPQCRELVTGTTLLDKTVSEVMCFFKCLKNFF